VKTKQRKSHARLSLAELEESAGSRPAGYLENCLAEPARIVGRWVFIPRQRFSALREQYRKNRPTLWQEIKTLAKEISKWKANGFRITCWRVFFARARACQACPFSFQRFLIRRCGRCGCTRAKLWLATARCPERRWLR